MATKQYVMNKYSGFVLKIIKQLEEKFNCIAYAYVEDTGKLWNICVNDYDMYMSNQDFKKFRHNWHIIAKKRKIGILFFYCNTIESKLGELANKDNLVMNI